MTKGDFWDGIKKGTTTDVSARTVIYGKLAGVVGLIEGIVFLILGGMSVVAMVTNMALAYCGAIPLCILAIGIGLVWGSLRVLDIPSGKDANVLAASGMFALLFLVVLLVMDALLLVAVVTEQMLLATLLHAALFAGALVIVIALFKRSQT